MSASKLVDHGSEQATGCAAAGSVEPLFLKSAVQVNPSINPRRRRRQVANTTTPAPTFKSDCERLLTMKAVTAVTSYSRTSINRFIEQRAFPVPVKLGLQRLSRKRNPRLDRLPTTAHRDHAGARIVLSKTSRHGRCGEFMNRQPTTGVRALRSRALAQAIDVYNYLTIHHEQLPPEVLADDLVDTHFWLCERSGQDPRSWNAIARELRRLTGGRKQYRWVERAGKRHRFRVYPVPRSRLRTQLNIDSGTPRPTPAARDQATTQLGLLRRSHGRPLAAARDAAS